MPQADDKIITPSNHLTSRDEACGPVTGKEGTGVSRAKSKNRDDWLPLWMLAKAIAPRTCALAAWWTAEEWGVNGPPIGPSVLARVTAKLRAHDPSVRAEVERIRANLRPWDDEARAVDAIWVNPVFLNLLNSEMECRTQARRRMGNTLRVRLSFLVRDQLSAGGYDVTAKTYDGTSVNLSERDLVGLEVDLTNSALSGDGTVYRAVRVRRRIPRVSEVAVAGTAAAAKGMVAWLEKLMREQPEKPIAKKRARQDAEKAGLGSISKRAFERAWVEAVQKSKAPAWGAAGRRKSYV